MVQNEENIPFSVKNIRFIKTPDGEFYLNVKLSPDIKPEKIQKTTVNLTKREKEILKELVSGKNNIQIAEDLIISVHTVKAHISNIFGKMGVSDRVRAVVKAVSENLTDIDYK